MKFFALSPTKKKVKENFYFMYLNRTHNSQTTTKVNKIKGRNAVKMMKNF